MQIQKPKQGYKLIKSLFGKYEEIPEKWNLVKLKEICTQITDGVHQTPSYKKNGIPFISVNNLKSGRLDFSNCNYVSIEDHKELIKSCYPQKGDIILSKVGTLGIADEITVNFEFSIFVQLSLLKLKKELVFPTFLKYMLNSKFIQNIIYSKAAGTTLQYIGINSISEIKIPFPDIREQQKIASILSNVDSLIQQTQKIIAQTQKFQKGLMQRLLTKGIGHTKFKRSKFGNIPQEWKIVKLQDSTSKIGSGITPLGGSQVYDKNGIPLIRSQNVHFDGLHLNNVAFISRKIHDEMKNTKLCPLDVLLNITGASIGRCTYLPEDFGEGNVNQHVCIIRTTENLNPIFLTKYLSQPIMQNKINSAQVGLSRQGLTFKEIADFDIVLPSIEEQQKIVSILSNIDSQIQKHKECQSKIENLKKGLLQKLLTGKIRVKI